MSCDNCHTHWDVLTYSCLGCGHMYCETCLNNARFVPECRRCPVYHNSVMNFRPPASVRWITSWIYSNPIMVCRFFLAMFGCYWIWAGCLEWLGRSRYLAWLSTVSLMSVAFYEDAKYKAATNKMRQIVRSASILGWFVLCWRFEAWWRLPHGACAVATSAVPWLLIKF